MKSVVAKALKVAAVVGGGAVIYVVGKAIGAAEGIFAGLEAGSAATVGATAPQATARAFAWYGSDMPSGIRKEASALAKAVLVDAAQADAAGSGPSSGGGSASGGGSSSSSGGAGG